MLELADVASIRWTWMSMLIQHIKICIWNEMKWRANIWFSDHRRNTDSEEMQRCPYLYEMKERLLSQATPADSVDMERLDGGTPVKEANLHNDYPAHTNPGVIPDPPEMPPDSLIGTVVKVNEPQVSHQHPFYSTFCFYYYLCTMYIHAIFFV